MRIRILLNFQFLVLSKRILQTLRIHRISKRMLERGANPNGEYMGQTILSIAADYFELVRLLLEYDANIDAGIYAGIYGAKTFFEYCRCGHYFNKKVNDIALLNMIN